ncbi:MAG: flavin reductase family protein [Bacteroidetes bacterium]|nr:flavin reductase family protein [Bacteroidota bacterium]
MAFQTVSPSEIPVPQLHQYLLGAIGPRPICFASTIDKNGNPNLAPFSFFNVFSANPPVVVFSPARSGRDGTTKHTHDNVKEVAEVVVNIVNFEMVQKMNVAAAPWEKGINEFEKAGFTAIPSDLIRPFRVAESPVQMECKVLRVEELSDKGSGGNLIIAEVIRIHMNENVLDESGKIDPRKMDLVGRMGGPWYCHATPENMFQLPQPMFTTIGYDHLPVAIKKSTVLSANDIGSIAGLQHFPDAEKIANVKTEFGQTDIEVTAKTLIIKGQIEDALCLFL